MRIAFDISPLTSGHKYRGTGFYTLRLKETFESHFTKEHEFIYFFGKKNLPQNVDIIHYPYFDPFSFSVPLNPKIPTIVTVLDLTPLIFPKLFPAGIKGTLLWQRQKLALKSIAGILTDSKSAKIDIEKITKISEEKIGMTYLAAGEEFKKLSNIQLQISTIKKKYSLPEKFALYVGDVTRNKNVPRIIKAAIQANIPLVMVGKALVSDNFDNTNPWNKDLVDIHLLLHDAKQIYRLGFIPDGDLVRLYNAASVFIMPSLYEGFGLPILEAMACGCPVITSRVGSLPEVAGNAAFFVDPYNIDDIAKSLKKIYTSTNAQNELSKKGLEQAKKFTWEKTAQGTISFYEKILNN